MKRENKPKEELEDMINEANSNRKGREIKKEIYISVFKKEKKEIYI